MKKLLILGGPIFQKPLIKKAQQMGCLVGVVDINADAPAASVADSFFQASIKDEESALRIAEAFDPDGIISGACDTSVRTVSYLCEKMHLPGNTQVAAFNSTDKVAMLESFQKAGVAHPAYQVVRSGEIGHFELAVPYPAISKPTDSAGGRGVHLIKSIEDVHSAVLMSSQAGASGDVLVEEFLEGPEVSVEVFLENGVPHVIQITDKITSGAPYFFELGHVQPSSLASETREAVKDLASRAVLAVGLKNGAAHVEVKVTPYGPKMIELGARMGGDCITTHLLDNSTVRFDMGESVVRQALGENGFIGEYENSGEFVAVKFMPSRLGILRSIDGIEDAKKCSGVIEAETMGVIGQRYLDAKDDSSRFAYVVAKGCSSDDALMKCDNALSCISVLLEECSA